MFIGRAVPDNAPENQAAQSIVENYPNAPEIKHGGNRAYYSPPADYVQMPNASNFDSANDYYRTLFHELIHSTGHQSLLNRELNTNHKSEAYAKEELIAEMGAVFLSAWAGILQFHLSMFEKYMAIDDIAALYGKGRKEEAQKDYAFVKERIERAFNHHLRAAKEYNTIEQCTERFIELLPDLLAKGGQWLEAKALNKKTAPAKGKFTKTYKQTSDEIASIAVGTNGNSSLKKNTEKAPRAAQYTGVKTIPLSDLYTDEKRFQNRSYILNLSWLNPKGATMSTLVQFSQTQSKADKNEAERIADWIGQARRNAPELTDAHEKEMFDFLTNKEASKRTTNKAKFLEYVRACYNPFEPTEPLNLARIKYQSEGEKQYDEEVEELKNNINKLQGNITDIKDRFINPNNPQYINPTAPDYLAIKQIADNKIAEYNTQIQYYQKKLLEVYQNKKNYIKPTGQMALFGKYPETDTPNLAAKMVALQARNWESFKIANPQMQRFLGDVELKESESTVITIGGGAGSGKTRFAFQFINALAQNYKVGHASLEEHPDSKLYYDKVKQYLDPTALANVEAPEIKNLQQLDELIQRNEVIVIDSFAKLRELDSRFMLDRDLRKKYNSKLFLLIYQLTGDGKMRGGSESEFDGDIILLTHVSPDYRENYIYPKKNRYNALPATQLRYSTYYQQMLPTEDTLSGIKEASNNTYEIVY